MSNPAFMSIELPWIYLLLLGAVLALIRLPVFRFLDDKAQVAARFAPLDGLRGVLAFSVFVFHVVVTYGYTTTGVWAPPSSNFYALLGPLGVSVFFMITGFLFWGKLLRAKARPAWRTLYIGRLFRIAPMYLFVVLAMLAIVMLRTGFVLQENAGSVLASTLQWLALGMINTQPDVNGYPATHVLAGVTWTIFYEWAFYASLLLSAPFARSRHHLAIVVAALVVSLVMKSLLASSAMGFAALFIIGMTVASLLHKDIRPSLRDSAASLVAAACIAAIFLAPRSAMALSGYGTPAAMLLAVFFYLVCAGATLFGLLTSTTARRFGDLSYSLYLLQGLVLTLVFGVGPIRTFAISSIGTFWAVGALCAVLLTGTAALTCRWIERPAIELGRRLARSPDRKRTSGEGYVIRVENTDGAASGTGGHSHLDRTIGDDTDRSVVGVSHPRLVQAREATADNRHHRPWATRARGKTLDVRLDVTGRHSAADREVGGRESDLRCSEYADGAGRCSGRNRHLNLRVPEYPDRSVVGVADPGQAGAGESRPIDGDYGADWPRGRGEIADANR